jgi:PAS domain S-box-containing protein
MEQETPLDFNVIFDTLPGNYLVVQPNPPLYTILAASDALLNSTGWSRNEVIGKWLFDLYPVNPDAPLDTALQQVIDTKEFIQLPAVRYAVRTGQGDHEERYYTIGNKPVLDPSGKVRSILQTFVDVTAQTRTEKAAQEPNPIAQKFDQMLQAPVAIAILTGPQHVVEVANEAAFHLLHSTPDKLGKPLKEALAQVQNPGLPAILDHVRATGQPYQINEHPATILLDGQQEVRYYNFLCQPYREHTTAPQPTGIFLVAHEVTDQVLSRKKFEESTKELRNLANAMPQIVWIAEPQGEVTYYNDRVSEFAGAKKLPDGTWHWESLLHPQDTQATVDAWNQAVAQGTGYEIEHRLQMKDGGLRWHLSRALPQKDENGNVIKWYGTATNVHEQKENEEALKRFKFMADQALDAFTLMRPDGSFAYLNPKALQAWGYTETEAPHLKVPDIDPIYQSEAFSQLFHKAQQENIPQFETLHRKKDGSIYPVEATVVGLILDGEPYLFAVARDITEHKKYEATLEAKNLELTRINNDLDNFIYTASHDLKSPISNIEGLLVILKEKLQHESDQKNEKRYILELMQDSVDRFKKTINSLTDVVKLQQESTTEPVLVSLAEVVEDVVLDLEPMIKGSGIRLDVDVAACPVIKFSEKNLRSVVYNLISNAIKYRSPNLVPHVQISCQVVGEFHVLTVQDNGLGIKAPANKLFSMFSRFHDHVEGTGIGLYMVKKMVENAGGRIEVDSEPGVGSTFRIYFKK